MSAYVSTWHVVLKVFVRFFRIKQEKASKQRLLGAIQLFQKMLSEEKQKVLSQDRKVMWAVSYPSFAGKCNNHSTKLVADFYSSLY